MTKQNRFGALLAAFVLGIALFFMLVADSGVRADSLTLAGSSTPSPTSSPTSTPSPTLTPRIIKKWTQVDGYLWWLVEWGSNKVLCDLTIDHVDEPIGTDILYGCGQLVYNTWMTSDGCISPHGGKDATSCPGLYLYFIKPVTLYREVTVKVPPPSASLLLSSDCTPVGITHYCEDSPSLVITGIEPMDEQLIVSIEGELNGNHFQCYRNPCKVPLYQTGPAGIHTTFWANSSYGDSSWHYSAAVRVVSLQPGNNTSTGNLKKWQVDVATSEWNGAPLAACSPSWEALPDVSGLPGWLDTPSNISSMASSNKYYFLAGELIRSGQVNAQACPNDGLVGPFTASVCGLEKSAALVATWQNQFDNTILSVAHNENMPAMLIKNIIGRESQFWPGVYSDINEVGLGQMTQGGADTLFMWNPDFYNKFCPNVFEKAECDKGYNNIPRYEKAFLKGALLGKVNTSCSDCVASVDLTQAAFSVDVLSSSLKANCEQTGQLLYDLTGEAAGSSSSYEDLWRYTLVNYNAGSGCLDKAIQKAIAAGLPLNWGNISASLATGCQGGIKYVNDIAQNTESASQDMGATLPISFPATPVIATSTQTATASPTWTMSRTPTSTSTAVRTASATPRQTAMPSQTSSDTAIPSSVSSETAVSISTAGSTSTSEPTATATPSPTRTMSQTSTPIADTATPSDTSTSETAAETPTPDK